MLTFAKIFTGFVIGVFTCSLLFFVATNPYTLDGGIRVFQKYTPTAQATPTPLVEQKSSIVEVPTLFITPSPQALPDSPLASLPTLSVSSSEQKTFSWTEEVVVGNFWHKVVGASILGDTLPGNEWRKEVKSQGKFIALTMDIQNNGKDSNGFSGIFLKLQDTQGRLFDFYIDGSLYIPKEFTCYGDVQPGFSRRCIFFFEIAADSSPLFLYIDDQEFMSEVPSVRVDLIK